jgi:hypothetical protein
VIFGPLAHFLLIKGTGIPVNKGWPTKLWYVFCGTIPIYDGRYPNSSLSPKVRVNLLEGQFDSSISVVRMCNGSWPSCRQNIQCRPPSCHMPPPHLLATGPYPSGVSTTATTPWWASLNGAPPRRHSLLRVASTWATISRHPPFSPVVFFEHIRTTFTAYSIPRWLSSFLYLPQQCEEESNSSSYRCQVRAFSWSLSTEGWC